VKKAQSNSLAGALKHPIELKAWAEWNCDLLKLHSG
jgi:hypothetical protein